MNILFSQLEYRNFLFSDIFHYFNTFSFFLIFFTKILLNNFFRHKNILYIFTMTLSFTSENNKGNLKWRMPPKKKKMKFKSFWNFLILYSIQSYPPQVISDPKFLGEILGRCNPKKAIFFMSSCSLPIIGKKVW